MEKEDFIDKYLSLSNVKRFVFALNYIEDFIDIIENDDFGDLTIHLSIGQVKGITKRGEILIYQNIWFPLCWQISIF